MVEYTSSIDDTLDYTTELSEESKSNNLSKIIYELMIPSDQLLYDNLEIKYKAREGIESLEIIANNESESFRGLATRAGDEEDDFTITMHYDREINAYRLVFETPYNSRIEVARQDFALKLDKFLEILPKSLMGGILGFTYLGSGKIARRDDLFGAMAKMVDVHESIHTPDEYETRVLTDWILKIELPKYKR